MKTLKVLLTFVVVLAFNCAYSQDLSVSELEKQTKAKMEKLPIDKKTNCYIRYYYFPNIEAYFDNLKMVYYFKEKGEWMTAPELPKGYGGYSLYNKARVTITDFDDEMPYQFLKAHRKMYPYNSKGRFTNTTASTE
ncbi:hypothetical protein [Flavobacterium terrisoli]|uniref:hypothetical protein n=1 Tax=Flavobacterium terrisoli TaxID=3242195 RepID=UPI00254382F9|nr:hypothetical protein [Flavobacterium buctense]